jgi:DNA-binding NarL/FixJ family response regulator
MEKEIQVIILEDDPFARNWMTLLVARDWRTKVVGDLNRPDMLPVFFKQNPALNIDIIVVDTETPMGGDWVQKTAKVIRDSGRSARILCTGIVASERILSKLADPISVGYVLKGEIPYSLAWAINLAMQGNWVATLGVESLMSTSAFAIPKSFMVLDGLQAPFGFSDERQAHEARLAILFSMERHELANELGIAEGWSYGKVRDYYEKMGLKALLDNEIDPEEDLKGQTLILSYLDEMKKDYSGEGKVKWMETMAFHLLTMPKVIK